MARDDAPGAGPANGANERTIDDAFAAEARRRSPLVFRTRTVSLCVVGCLLLILIERPEAYYYIALIIGFILLGWLQFELSRQGAGSFAIYVLIALDMALFVFAVIYPNPFALPEAPPQYVLRFGNFIYLFLIIGAVAISLSPRLILWSAGCGVVFWALGVAWLTVMPDSIVERVFGGPELTDAEQIAQSLKPHFVDLGVQLQNIVVMLIVAGALAASAGASRRLLLRETAQARRVANLSRYLPAETVTTLAGRNDPFGGEAEREAGILFTDIVGFSSIAERLTPQETLALLRRTHGLVERVIFDHGGAIDKFMGDGIMATFGAYRTGATGPEEAVACVEAILTAMDDANAARPAGEPEVNISIGLHYGRVLVGDLGSERRMEFAVIGDAVNVAARLETMTRELGVAAAISEETYYAAGRPDGFERIGARAVRGRIGSVTIWAPVGRRRNPQPADGLND